MSAVKDFVELGTLCDRPVSSIDVRFNKVCDNDCKFCIDKTGLDDLGKTDVEKLIESTNKIGKVDDILILGGEPFLECDKLLQYLEGIKRNEVYITTSLPKTFSSKKETCYKILDSITGLNISLHGLTDEDNNKTLRAKSNHSRFELIKQLCDDGYADKIRICIVLNNKTFYNESIVRQLVEKVYSYGIRSIKFGELCHAEDEYVSIEKVFNIKMCPPYISCMTDISSLFNLDGLFVMVKRACFIVNKNTGCSFLEFMKIFYMGFFRKFIKSNKRFYVIYENGEISDEWKLK